MTEVSQGLLLEFLPIFSMNAVSLDSEIGACLWYCQTDGIRHLFPVTQSRLRVPYIALVAVNVLRSSKLDCFATTKKQLGDYIYGGHGQIRLSLKTQEQRKRHMKSSSYKLIQL